MAVINYLSNKDILTNVVGFSPFCVRGIAILFYFHNVKF